MPNVINIIPAPNGPASRLPGSLSLPDPLRVSLGGFSPDCLTAFAERAGLRVALVEESPLLRCVRNPAFPPEAHRLRVSESRGVEVEAATEQGVIWALTSLFALLEGKSAPCCDVFDAPVYAYRGLHLDCVRHFFPVPVILETIEEAALTKLNVFHWHLSDDQGWRIESLRFPELYAGQEHYTRAEIRTVVEYARLRGVEIMPEIELPGHTTAMLAAHPELGCTGQPLEVGTAPGIYSTVLCPGKESTFDFLLSLLDEVAELFPSPRFHIGGDEVPKTAWKTCPHCQERMEALGLRNWEDLQGWFTCRVADHMRSLGKQCHCWNETLASALRPEDVTIQFWAEMHRWGDVQQFCASGGQCVFSDMMYLYLDYAHAFNPLRRVYGIDLAQEGLSQALGLECCLWTEFIEGKQQLWAHAFPRALAMAEAAWTSAGRKDYEGFCARLALWNRRRGNPFLIDPQQVDPSAAAIRSERLRWLRQMKDAPRPEQSAGLGGALHPAYALKWTRWFF